MITITDNPTKGQEHWQVVDSNKNLNGDIPYIVDDTGFDRVRVLQEIVELYSVLSACKSKGWQQGQTGRVYILA